MNETVDFTNVLWMFKKSLNYACSLRWTGQYRICIIKAHYAMIAEYKKEKIDNIIINRKKKFLIVTAPRYDS